MWRSYLIQSDNLIQDIASGRPGTTGASTPPLDSDWPVPELRAALLGDARSIATLLEFQTIGQILHTAAEGADHLDVADAARALLATPAIAAVVDAPTLETVLELAAVQLHGSASDVAAPPLQWRACCWGLCVQQVSIALALAALPASEVALVCKPWAAVPSDTSLSVPDCVAVVAAATSLPANAVQAAVEWAHDAGLLAAAGSLTALDLGSSVRIGELARAWAELYGGVHQLPALAPHGVGLEDTGASADLTAADNMAPVIDLCLSSTAEDAQYLRRQSWCPVPCAFAADVAAMATASDAPDSGMWGCIQQATAGTAATLQRTAWRAIMPWDSTDQGAPDCAAPAPVRAACGASVSLSLHWPNPEAQPLWLWQRWGTHSAEPGVARAAVWSGQSDAELRGAGFKCCRTSLAHGMALAPHRYLWYSAASSSEAARAALVLVCRGTEPELVDQARAWLLQQGWQPCAGALAGLHTRPDMQLWLWTQSVLPPLQGAHIARLADADSAREQEHQAALWSLACSQLLVGWTDQAESSAAPALPAAMDRCWMQAVRSTGRLNAVGDDDDAWLSQHEFLRAVMQPAPGLRMGEDGRGHVAVRADGVRLAMGLSADSARELLQAISKRAHGRLYLHMWRDWAAQRGLWGGGALAAWTTAWPHSPAQSTRMVQNSAHPAACLALALSVGLPASLLAGAHQLRQARYGQGNGAQPELVELPLPVLLQEWARGLPAAADRSAAACHILSRVAGGELGRLHPAASEGIELDLQLDLTTTLQMLCGQQREAPSAAAALGQTMLCLREEWGGVVIPGLDARRMWRMLACAGQPAPALAARPQLLTLWQLTSAICAAQWTRLRLLSWQLLVGAAAGAEVQLHAGAAQLAQGKADAASAQAALSVQDCALGAHGWVIRHVAESDRAGDALAKLTRSAGAVLARLRVRSLGQRASSSDHTEDTSPWRVLCSLDAQMRVRATEQQVAWLADVARAKAGAERDVRAALLTWIVEHSAGLGAAQHVQGPLQVCQALQAAQAACREYRPEELLAPLVVHRTAVLSIRAAAPAHVRALLDCTTGVDVLAPWQAAETVLLAACGDDWTGGAQPVACLLKMAAEPGGKVSLIALSQLLREAAALDGTGVCAAQVLRDVQDAALQSARSGHPRARSSAAVLAAEQDGMSVASSCSVGSTSCSSSTTTRSSSSAGSAKSSSQHSPRASVAASSDGVSVQSSDDGSERDAGSAVASAAPSPRSAFGAGSTRSSSSRSEASFASSAKHRARRVVGKLYITRSRSQESELPADAAQCPVRWSRSSGTASDLSAGHAVYPVVLWSAASRPAKGWIVKLRVLDAAAAEEAAARHGSQKCRVVGKLPCNARIVAQYNRGGSTDAARQAVTQCCCTARALSGSSRTGRLPPHSAGSAASRVYDHKGPQGRHWHCAGGWLVNAVPFSPARGRDAPVPRGQSSLCLWYRTPMEACSRQEAREWLALHSDQSKRSRQRKSSRRSKVRPASRAASSASSSVQSLTKSSSASLSTGHDSSSKHRVRTRHQARRNHPARGRRKFSRSRSRSHSSDSGAAFHETLRSLFQEQGGQPGSRVTPSPTNMPAPPAALAKVYAPKLHIPGDIRAALAQARLAWRRSALAGDVPPDPWTLFSAHGADAHSGRMPRTEFLRVWISQAGGAGLTSSEQARAVVAWLVQASGQLREHGTDVDARMFSALLLRQAPFITGIVTAARVRLALRAARPAAGASAWAAGVLDIGVDEAARGTHTMPLQRLYRALKVRATLGLGEAAMLDVSVAIGCPVLLGGAVPVMHWFASVLAGGQPGAPATATDPRVEPLLAPLRAALRDAARRQALLAHASTLGDGPAVEMAGSVPAVRRAAGVPAAGPLSPEQFAQLLQHASAQPVGSAQAGAARTALAEAGSDVDHALALLVPLTAAELGRLQRVCATGLAASGTLAALRRDIAQRCGHEHTLSAPDFALVVSRAQLPLSEVQVACLAHAFRAADGRVDPVAFLAWLTGVQAVAMGPVDSPARVADAPQPSLLNASAASPPLSVRSPTGKELEHLLSATPGRVRSRQVAAQLASADPKLSIAQAGQAGAAAAVAAAAPSALSPATLRNLQRWADGTTWLTSQRAPVEGAASTAAALAVRNAEQLARWQSCGEWTCPNCGAAQRDWAPRCDICAQACPLSVQHSAAPRASTQRHDPDQSLAAAGQRSIAAWTGASTPPQVARKLPFESSKSEDASHAAQAAPRPMVHISRAPSSYTSSLASPARTAGPHFADLPANSPGRLAATALVSTGPSHTAAPPAPHAAPKWRRAAEPSSMPSLEQSPLRIGAALLTTKSSQAAPRTAGPFAWH